MRDYVMTYMLKQDSPMIHFQGTTQGAALRPSEVKPKLDRFLKEWCGRKKITEKPEWKTDPAHEAYDYKMRIYAGKMKYQYPAAAKGNQNRSFNQNRGRNQQAPPEFQYDKLPSYFGDLVGGRTNLWYTDGVTLEMICFHKELRAVIKDAVETFFVLHNFGTRQNRGIGGFTLRETTSEKAEKLLVEWFQPRITIYKMVFPQNTDAVRILKCGNMFYQILKSGVNERNIYIKSCLTKCFLDKGIGGEKRWMKERNISPAIGRIPSHGANHVAKYRFIRGLLGTASSIRYQAGSRPDGRKMWESVNIAGKRLDRVPSPIRYKLVKDVLFLIPLIPGYDLLGQGKEICGELFDFRNRDNRDRDRGTLDIPSRAEFDMNTFIKEYVRYIRQGQGVKDGVPASIPDCVNAYKDRYNNWCQNRYNNQNLGIVLPTSTPTPIPGARQRPIVRNGAPYWIEQCAGGTVCKNT